MALEKELETYRSKLPDLKKHEGKFVLIHGDDLTVWDTYADANREGYRKFKLDPFLVKRIESNGQVHFVTRGLKPVNV
jgi:hypothetical protein